jgi:polar amino acid transport system substrate-binding protein
MIAYFSFIFRLLLLSLLLIQPSKAEQYHFVSISGLYVQEIGQIVLPKIYQKLGIEISITPMPGNRAMLETVSGRMDGETMRIESYGIDHPEALRIPTPYYQIDTTAFYKKDSGIVISSVADLAKYSLLRVRGVKHTMNITEGFEKVYDYDDTKSMLNALDKHRDHVALTHTGDGLFAIEKYNINHVEYSDKPLSLLSVYHYVHKKNAHLVEKVDRVIREMNESGELDQLIKEAEKKLFELNGLPFKRAAASHKR